MRRILAVLVTAILMLPLMLASGVLAQDGYRIRPGDTLRIEILEDPGLNRSVLVSPDGRIAFPLAGGVAASGRTLEQVQTDLAARIAPNFAATPNVFISVERVAERPAGSGGARAAAVATIDVFVMGEAAKPGKLELERGTNVLQAFAQMGGFTKFAATKRVQLRRGPKTYGMNYKAIEDGTSTAGATVLHDGDVIVVPQRRLFE